MQYLRQQLIQRAPHKFAKSTTQTRNPVLTTDNTPQTYSSKTCKDCNTPITGRYQRCKPCQKKHASALQMQSQRRKQNCGICLTCPECAEPPFRFCLPCRERRLVINRARQKRKREQGICAHCTRPAQPMRRLCELHNKQRKRRFS